MKPAVVLAAGAGSFWAVRRLLARSLRDHDTRAALGGPRGINVRESITIRRPVEDVYRHWRDLTALPRFMPHLDRVERIGDGRTHWVARGPGNLRMSWDAEVINEREPKLLAWRSIAGGDVVMAGSVNFRRASRGGTTLRVNLQYAPPAGRAGAWVATLLGSDPAAQIRDDLRTLKRLLESEEAVPTS